MKFEKDVIYLGRTPNTLSDGKTYWSVDLFDKETGTLKVNVMDDARNFDTLTALASLDFGAPLTVTFQLKPKDKLWRITIDHVA